MKADGADGADADVREGGGGGEETLAAALGSTITVTFGETGEGEMEVLGVVFIARLFRSPVCATPFVSREEAWVEVVAAPGVANAASSSRSAAFRSLESW